jgi:hypothetical protein
MTRSERAPAVAFGYVRGMDEFIDVEGASGARYRFRRTPELPTSAGNFVFVRRDGEGARIAGCGSANSLVEVVRLWPRAVEQEQADGLYVYLNVARRTRNEVHKDIAEKHQPALIAVELGL